MSKVKSAAEACLACCFLFDPSEARMTYRTSLRCDSVVIYEGIEMAGMNERQGSATILLADDDRSLRVATAQMLSEAGYICAEASNGSQALERFTNMKPDLVILDIMMPGLDGFEVCERIRQADSMVPVLFFSAKGDIVDKRIGYKLGADDYLVKPFAEEELLLRVEALLRRACRTQGMASDCAGGKDLGMREIGDLRVDLRHGDVWRRGEKIALTPKERRIMATLAEHPGETFDRNDLIRLVWGEEYLNTSISIPVYITCKRYGGLDTAWVISLS